MHLLPYPTLSPSGQRVLSGPSHQPCPQRPGLSGDSHHRTPTKPREDPATKRVCPHLQTHRDSAGRGSLHVIWTLPSLHMGVTPMVFARRRPLNRCFRPPPVEFRENLLQTLAPPSRPA
jgi:hypothetical protein